MAFQDDNRPQRQMIDVSNLSLSCAECNQPINELPFQPTIKEDGTYGKLYCRDCNRKRMQDRGPRRSFGGGHRDRY